MLLLYLKARRIFQLRSSIIIGFLLVMDGLFGTYLNAVTPPGTTITGSAFASYEVNNNGVPVLITVSAPISSNAIYITTSAEIYQPILVPNGNAADSNQILGEPNQIVTASYTLQNGGNMPDAFTLRPSFVSGDFTPTFLAVYIDANNNGRIELGEVPLAGNSPTLAPGEALPLLLQLSLPSAVSSGARAVINLEAESVNAPIQTIDMNNEAEVLVTTSALPFLNLTANTRRIASGGTVSFSLSILNNGRSEIDTRSVLLDGSFVDGTLLAYHLADTSVTNYTLDVSSLNTSESGSHSFVFSDDGGSTWSLTDFGASTTSVALLYQRAITTSQSINFNFDVQIDNLSSDSYFIFSQAELGYSEGGSAERILSNQVLLELAESAAALASAGNFFIGPNGAPDAAGAADRVLSLDASGLPPAVHFAGGTYYHEVELENLTGAATAFELFPLYTGITGGVVSSTFFQADRVTELVDSDGDGSPESPSIPNGGRLRLFVATSIAPDFTSTSVEQNFYLRSMPFVPGGTLSSAGFEYVQLVFTTAGATNIIQPKEAWNFSLAYTTQPTGQEGERIGITLNFEELSGSDVTGAILNTEYKPWIGLPIDPDTGAPIASPSGTYSIEIQTSNGPINGTMEYQEDPSNPGMFRIQILVGSLSGLTSGSVAIEFQQLGVLSSVQPDLKLQLAATLTTNEFSLASVVSNQALVDLNDGVISITKTPSAREVMVGDPVAFKLNILNVESTAAIAGIEVEDILPLGLRFSSGSATLDGIRIETAVGQNGRTLHWDLSANSLVSGDSMELSYECVVTDEAQASYLTNFASVSSNLGSGVSASTSASIRVKPGVFTAEAVLAGQVYWDKDLDGRYSEGDTSVADTIVQLSDGRRVKTDLDGRYSVAKIAPGPHALRLVEHSLPSGLQVQNDARLDRGTPETRMIDVRYGEFEVVNFRLTGKILEAPATVDDIEADALKQTVSADAKFGILNPLDQSIIRDRDQLTAAVSYPISATPVLLFNGQIVDAAFFGTKKIFPKERKIHQELVGLPLVDGPNILELKYQKTKEAPVQHSVTIHKPGTPIEVKAHIPKLGFVADGHSSAFVKFELYDAFGYTTGNNTVLELSIDRGSILSEDFRPSAEGFQVLINSGHALIELSPTEHSETRELTVEFGTYKNVIPITFNLKNQDWEIAGVAEQGFGQSYMEGHYQAADAQTASFIAQGPVTKDGSWQAIVGYDSRRDINEDPDFGRLNQSEEDRYENMGDRSTLSNPYASREPLYLRVENKDHTFMYGDFSTSLDRSMLARHDRKLTGGHLHSVLKDQYGSWDTKAFIARDDTNAHVFRTPVSEIIGALELDQNYIAPGSETIYLELYDGDQPDRLLETDTLKRGADYTIDYTTGRIFFNRDLADTDFDFNVYVLRIEYETNSFEESSLTYGGRLERALGQLTVGSTYTVEDSDNGLNYVAGYDLSYQFENGSNVWAEFSHSKDQFLGAGSAHAFGWEKHGDKSLHKLNYYYGEEDFSNRYARNIELGQHVVTWDSEWTHANGIRSNFKYEYEQRDDSNEYKHVGLYEIEKKFDQHTVSLKGGYFHGVVEANESVIQTPIIGASWQTQLTQKLGIDLSSTYAFEDLDYDTPTQYQAGLNWNTGDDSRIRMGYKAKRDRNGEWREGLNIRSERSISDGLEYYNELGQPESGDGDLLTMVQGVNFNKPFNDELTLTAQMESNKNWAAAEGATQNTGFRDYSSGSLGFSWIPDDVTEMRGLSQYAVYDDEQNTFFELEYSGRLRTSYTLLARMRLSNTAYDKVQDEYYLSGKLGLAYRPSAKSDWVYLASFESNIESLASNSNLNRLNHNTFSMEANWQPLQPFELSLRYANRLSRLGDAGSWHATDLKVVDMRFGIYDQIDLVLGTRWMHSYDLGYDRFSYGTGLAYEIYNGLELELGYNVAGLDDANFSDNNYNRQGFYFVTRWTFDEDWLRKVAESFRSR